MFVFIILLGGCAVCWIQVFASEQNGTRSVLFNLSVPDEDLVSFLMAINAHNQTVLCLSSVSASLWIPLCVVFLLFAAEWWASNSKVSKPPVFIRLSWIEARLCATSPPPELPAVLMALGHRQEQEDLDNLLSAAVMRCLQPASYQMEQPDKPVPSSTPLRSRRRILKPATSNNSGTNLRIGDLKVVKTVAVGVIHRDLWLLSWSVWALSAIF